MFWMQKPKYKNKNALKLLEENDLLVMSDGCIVIMNQKRMETMVEQSAQHF